MGSNIFSTYSTGENRVTASILAVIQSLSLSRIERLLGALMEESEFELVRFQNQPASGGSGVPDAVILTSCRLLIETKTSRNAVRSEQLRRHLDRLDKESESMQRLLVLTPDNSHPDQIAEVNAKGRTTASNLLSLSSTFAGFPPLLLACRAFLSTAFGTWIQKPGRRHINLQSLTD